MPVAAQVRAGSVAATALVLALLSGSPALADTSLVVGDACTPDTVLDPGLICQDNLVAPAPAPAAETPSPDPTPTDPPSATPTPEPDPTTPPPVVEVPSDPVPDPGVPSVPTDPAPDPGTGGGGDSGSGPVAGVPDPGNGSGTPVPAPGGDVGAPTGTGDGTTAGGTTDPTTTGMTQPGPTLQAAATGVPAPILATPSLLDSATAAIVATNDPIALAMLQNHTAAVPKPTLAPSLSAFPLAANLAGLPINSPIAKVQEPLLAAGDEAAQGGGFALAGLSSKALPGLLVVLATALVATVGAANIRTWQERLARLHGDS